MDQSVYSGNFHRNAFDIRQSRGVVEDRRLAANDFETMFNLTRLMALLSMTLKQRQCGTGKHLVAA